MKKIKNVRPGTYAYKIILKKWYYDYVIHRCISSRIFRFVVAKNSTEVRKLVTRVINKKTNSSGPYWYIISIAKVSKKELIRKQRQQLHQVACRTTVHSLDKQIIL